MSQITEYFGPDNEYEVLLDTDMEMSKEEKGGRDVVTGCWITHKPTGCSASLAALEGTGILEMDRGFEHLEHRVPVFYIDQIGDWADSNGY